MLVWILKPLARLPLRVLQTIGAVLGMTAFFFSARMRNQIRENVIQSGLVHEDLDAFCRFNAREVGKSTAETLALWLRPDSAMLDRTRVDEAWTNVLKLYAKGRGLIILTPHLGGFEILPRFFARFMPFTILYRPPKLRWLEPLMRYGRMRSQISLATTDRRGVRTLLRALRRGEAIGLLPDQVPGQGEGVWTEFFGRPAYTMTLVARLQQATGAHIAILVVERLSSAGGYHLHIRPLTEPLPTDALAAARAINRAIEHAIRIQPTQYLWSYNRYKVPAGVAPPPRSLEARRPARSC